MDIDGIQRCPRCFSLWDETICPSCGYKAEENGGASISHLAQETILQGRYLIGSVLGTGGFGITYAAWDLKLDVPIAIKEYFPRGLASRDTSATDEVETQASEENAHAFATGLNRFIREARVLALLNAHAEIVSIRDCIEENNTAYIIMEYLHGKNLYVYAADSEGRIPPKELLPMMRAPIQALARIHEMGMLHRDVSPSNLMLEPDGRVKLIDFGAVMDYGQAGPGQNATVILNRRYAAPEQYLPDGALGPWTDVYGVCATLYALLTGKTPQEASNGRDGAVPPLRSQGVNVTRRQERAILRGLVENPKHRIQSMPELMSPLFGVPLPEELRRRKRLARIAASAVATTLLLSIVVLANAVSGFPGGAGAYYRLGANGFSLNRYGGDGDTSSLRTHFLGIPITMIGDMAFYGNETLTNINIPESVTSIGAFAFAECEALRAVWLPDGVQDIAPGAFDRCDGRLTLYGADGSYAARYAAEHGLRFSDPSLFAARIENGEATLISSAEHAVTFYEELVVPPFLSGAPVTGIASGMHAKRLILPDTVRRIEEYAFYQEILEEVLMEEGLETIGPHAFDDSRIRSLVIPNTVTSIGEEAFYNCSELRSVRFPSSLDSLGAGAFVRCAQLTETHLPDGLAVIEEWAFGNCERLAKVVLPSQLHSIEEYAFVGCWKLVEIIVPEGTEHIGDVAFGNCRQLSRVILPASVTSIGEGAFEGCAPDLTLYGFVGSAAETYAVDNDIHFVDMGRWTPAEAFIYEVREDGVSISGYVGDFADVVMPDYIQGVPVTDIVNDNASFEWEHAGELRSIVLPRMATVIPYALFMDCESLVSVELPEGLTVIDYEAFLGCTSLEKVSFPSSLVEIGWEAFRGCTSLVEIAFLSALTEIDDEAFQECESLAIVRGVKGTYAETWARENGIGFEEVP